MNHQSSDSICSCVKIDGKVGWKPLRNDVYRRSRYVTRTFRLIEKHSQVLYVLEITGMIRLAKPMIFVITLFVVSCSTDNVNRFEEGDSKFQRETKSFNSMDDFGTQIFKLIQLDKYDEILELMPDMSELEIMIDGSSLDDDKKDARRKKLEEELKDDIESLKKTYDKFREKTEEAGIDWAKSTLSYIDYEHKKENRIETADLFLTFSFKGVSYEIELKNCTKISGSWLIGNEINWHTQDARSGNSWYY